MKAAVELMLMNISKKRRDAGGSKKQDTASPNAADALTQESKLSYASKLGKIQSAAGFPQQTTEHSLLPADRPTLKSQLMQKNILKELNLFLSIEVRETLEKIFWNQIGPQAMLVKRPVEDRAAEIHEAFYDHLNMKGSVY